MEAFGGTYAAIATYESDIESPAALVFVFLILLYYCIICAKTGICLYSV